MNANRLQTDIFVRGTGGAGLFAAPHAQGAAPALALEHDAFTGVRLGLSPTANTRHAAV